MPIRQIVVAMCLACLPIGARAALFARHAVPVSDIYGGPRPKTVTAPDGRTRAIARFTDWKSDDSDNRLTVFLGGDDHEFEGGPNAELLWAPDSRAIAVTADDGGATGSFALSVLVRNAKGRHWRQIDLTDAVTRLFAPRMRCKGDEVPNVGAVGWTSGQRLVVTAQVPPHSSCANMGMTAAYIVDIPSGGILMNIDRRTLRQRYRRMLGTMFAPHGRHHHHRRHRP